MPPGSGRSFSGSLGPFRGPCCGHDGLFWVGLGASSTVRGLGNIEKARARQFPSLSGKQRLSCLQAVLAIILELSSRRGGLFSCLAAMWGLFQALWTRRRCSCAVLERIFSAVGTSVAGF